MDSSPTLAKLILDSIRRTPSGPFYQRRQYLVRFVKEQMLTLSTKGA